jgi:hypothetical protein
VGVEEFVAIARVIGAEAVESFARLKIDRMVVSYHMSLQFEGCCISVDMGDFESARFLTGG